MLRLKKRTSAFVQDEEEVKRKRQEDLFSSSSSDESDIKVTAVDIAKQGTRKNRGNLPAWYDSDDSDDDEDARKKRFEKEFCPILRPAPTVDSDDDADGADDATAGEVRAGPVLGKSAVLAPSQLRYKRLRDANADQPAKAQVTSVRFHPWSPVALVSSTDRHINFFHIDGDRNEKLSSHYFDRFPIKCARFTPDGKKVVAASICKSFRVVDLESEKMQAIRQLRGVTSPIQQFEVSPDGRFIVFIGMWGALHVVETKSMEKVATLEANGRIWSLAFAGESLLYAFGDDGRVYRFSMAALCLDSSFVDEGCVGGRALAVSGDNEFLACGHSTGVVNVYRHSETFCSGATDLSTPAPRPLKAVANLLTGCDRLRFGPGGELLLMASSHDYQAVRALHTASRTVFSNFPGRADRLAKVTDLDVSPGGAYLAVGQSDGRAALLRLLHYDRY